MDIDLSEDSDADPLEQIDQLCTENEDIENLNRHTAEGNKQKDGLVNNAECHIHNKEYERYFCLNNIKLLVYGLHVLKGIIYPLIKVTMMALTSKLVQDVLHVSLNDDVFMQVEKELFGAVRSSSITSIFLMESLNFHQTFAVAAALVSVLSITYPLGLGLSRFYLNYMEVKRLQRLLYDKFIMEPNSVDQQEARDLVYTKIASIENHWTDHKFWIVDDITTIVCSLFLFLLLAWDLGLIYCGAAFIIVFGTELCWRKLSRPWLEQREKKMSETNARLMDLVTCKDVVLTHTMELDERIILERLINSDKKEINHLWKAKAISSCMRVGTFTMLIPLLCLYVYSVDLTLERVFQFLIVLVVTDECMRAYLSYVSHGPYLEENKRAKQAFASVLGMDESKLFPPDFVCPFSKGSKKPPPTKHGSLACGFSDQCATRNDTGASTPYAESDSGLNLQNVSLGYARRNESPSIVVQNLNLSFPIGSRTAIMGESGEGKSTIFKSITGLIPLLEGHISMGGRCIDATSCYWRKQVAAVSQDSVLFNRTLRENLTYGKSHMQDEDILQVLDKVHLREMVIALPKKLDTIICDNGKEFSGGERQRIQIARLLLSTCPVILLDEITSALDPKTALDVVNELKTFAEGKTLIMITHNVQTLHLVENVFQMKKKGLISTKRASTLLRTDKKRTVAF